MEFPEDSENALGQRNPPDMLLAFGHVVREGVTAWLMGPQEMLAAPRSLQSMFEVLGPTEEFTIKLTKLKLQDSSLPQVPAGGGSCLELYSVLGGKQKPGRSQEAYEISV